MKSGIEQTRSEILQVIETGILPDGDHVNVATEMWLERISEKLAPDWDEGCKGCKYEPDALKSKCFMGEHWHYDLCYTKRS